MDVVSYLRQSTQPDPTWSTAQEHVQSVLSLPDGLIRLIRRGWGAQLDVKEFLRLVAASRLNAGCLLEAAEIRGDGRKPQMVYIVKAVESLGITYASVVVTVNTLTRLVLKSLPPPLWKNILKDMMSSIETGYRFGGKVAEIGPAGGALMGFCEHLGTLILLISDPNAVKEWRVMIKMHGRVGRKIEIDLFGCEPYQVSAMALQQLGFGIEIAVGAAIGVGRITPEHISIDQNIMQWKAAVHWINALRHGRDVPPEVDIRNFFSAVAPPKKRSEKNLTLTVLYTELAKVKSEGSQWTWHLPLPSYETTAAKWGI